MRKSLLLLVFFALFLPLVFLGCEGDDGAQGPPGEKGEQGEQGLPGEDATAALSPETCALCHNGEVARDGQSHQDYYDSLYKDGVILVSNLAYNNDGTNDIVTFEMTKAGADFDCTESSSSGNSLGIYFTTYTGATYPGNSFEQDGSLTIGTSGSSSTPSTLSYDGATNTCTSTKAQSALGNLSAVDGLIVLYGRNERLGTLPERVQQAKYPFAALLPTGGFAIGDYTSAANVAGCEKCHTVPFLKHGYIYGQVGGDPDTQFYACKACHLDNRTGGHFTWQLLVNDPRLIITLEDEYGSDWERDAADAADPRLDSYQYKARLMNDVHMSHAMEFPYPQSMSNCATCHEGKLATITADENFVPETCKSCHPVTAAAYADKDYTELVSENRAPALLDIMPSSFHGDNTAKLALLESGNCTLCHFPGSVAQLKTFSLIHTGYDKQIYGAPGQKYADAITVSIGTPSFDDNTSQLSFSFSGTGSLNGVNGSGLDNATSVLIGLYGYNTKDFRVGPHRRTIDGNRDLESTITGSTTHPRISVTATAPGSWDVTADLSLWAALIADGTVKKAEIAVTPYLKDTDGVLLGINAPSVTFSLVDNTVVENYFKGDNQIVKVEEGCNNCHDQLATTFHTTNKGRGGNIVVCRMCHVSIDDGSHIELQSRSITSYAHAIHSFQAFDIGDIDFTDPVEALLYDEHIEFQFPTLGIQDCEACHEADKFNEVDQSKSLAGLLSGTDDVNKVRNIGDIPKRVIGPAGLACGSCHRSHEINEDEAGELATLFAHWKQFGYLVDVDVATSAEEDVITLGVIETIMAMI